MVEEKQAFEVPCLVSAESSNSQVAASAPAMTVSLPLAQTVAEPSVTTVTEHSQPVATVSDPLYLTELAAPQPLSPGTTTTAASQDSFSWAWITPRPNGPTNNTNEQGSVNLGFVFQKPVRHQTRSERRSSTHPYHPMSPDYRVVTSAAMPPTSALTMDLDTVFSQMTPVSQPSPADTCQSDELTALLSNLLTPAEGGEDVVQPHPTTTAPPQPRPPPPQPQPSLPAAERVSCCGFCGPCRPTASHDQEESVVVTITPLPKQVASRSSSSTPTAPTMTRVVTCYCGPSCTCPGCLVHPGNSFLGNPTLDPYAGPLAHQTMSSASSSCESDEDR